MAGKSGKKAKAAQESANARALATSLSVTDEVAAVLAAMPGTPAVLGAQIPAPPTGESAGFSVEFDVLTGLLAPILARVESLETRLSALASAPQAAPARATKGARNAIAAATADFESLTADEIAKLSSGLASPARASLALALAHEESLSPSELGHATKLATGSLYHHLREMIAAGVLTQGERNQYELSPAGRRILQALTRTTPANSERVSQKNDA